MDFLGKVYTLQKNENFDAFINTLNLPKETAEAFVNSKASQKIEKEGDEFVITTIAENGPSVLRFKNGVEFEENLSGVVAKNVITVDGNKVTQVQTADGKSITYVREYSANQLLVTITSSFWDGVAKRTYVA